MSNWKYKAQPMRKGCRYGGKERRPRKTFYYEDKKYEATGKTPEEAIANAALMRDRLKRGEVGISCNMTVKRWTDEWLETYKKPVLAKKQYDDYKGMIDNIIVPEVGSLRLANVKDIHLQKILSSKAGYSLDRLSKLKNRINAMFRQAYASKLINHNPAEFLTLPKAVNGTHRSISENEREHFLRVASNHYAGLMFKTMLFCGLRTGEVVALEWRDIDFEKSESKHLAPWKVERMKLRHPRPQQALERFRFQMRYIMISSAQRVTRLSQSLLARMVKGDIPI